MKYKIYRGKDIETVFESLAQLRITVFKDYPYLYEGTLEYEKEYLKIYARSARSFLFAVFDNDKMVGATTCIPLVDETDEVKKPFLEVGLDIDKIFYFGESILLAQYRGLGLGNRFFDERENHARSFGEFEITCFCAVQRPDNYPLKPEDYRPLDEFWQKRGYQRQGILQSQFDWLDINESVSTSKPMIYWTKNI
ncbi:MAG: GNAT family N-acetyltransferase [Bacteroidota bacterium]